MPNPTWTKIVIYLAAATWFVTSLFTGSPTDSSLLRTLGTVSSIVVFAIMLFDTLIWRWLPHALTSMPNLRGTWKMTLLSNFKDEKGKQVELTCFLVIRQSYSKIHIEMLFPKSESTSTSAAVIKSDGTSELWYSYHSVAHSLDREDNPPHMGAARLRIAMNSSIKLSGDYWTDRKTFGRLETVSHSNKLVTDYQEAMQSFN